jgi:nitroreductase
MISNDVIELIMNRASLRSYTDEVPSDEVIATVVRAGQQAPFSMQMCSVILEREGKIPWGAPLNFIICADVHRIGLIAKKRGWDLRMNDVTLLLFAIQDAACMAQNMVIAAESLGMGSCFIGAAPMLAPKIIERYKLPPKVFPLVMLVMGYPAEKKPTRPRYPVSFTLFEKEYPKFTGKQVEEAMRVMDEGYLAQDYYENAGLKLPLEGSRADTFTFEDYSWTEHISRKLQWMPSPDGILENLRKCGFEMRQKRCAD